jgi:hypothetical protein
LKKIDLDKDAPLRTPPKYKHKRSKTTAANRGNIPKAAKGVKPFLKSEVLFENPIMKVIKANG